MEPRRELINVIRRQILADIEIEMPDQEREARMLDVVLANLTPQEGNMSSEDLGVLLAVASRVALSEIEAL